MELSFVDNIKRILSYVYPISKKIESPVSGTLEVTWYNGKKILNSKNANYSYGSLQRILKFGLKQIDMSGVNSVLLLGMGGGSVIKTLREEFNYTKKITAVSIDKTMIDIARDEFNISAGDNLEIINDDANKYVRATIHKFDLIIIDLFIDNTVPEIFYSLDFWKKIENITLRNGYVIFNASVHSLSKNKLNVITEGLTGTFLFEKHNLVEGTNTLIIGKKLNP